MQPVRPTTTDYPVHAPGSPVASAPDAAAGLTGTQAGAASAHVRSDWLLGGRRVVKIEHNGVLYELRATRLGKLILTK